MTMRPAFMNRASGIPVIGGEQPVAFRDSRLIPKGEPRFAIADLAVALAVSTP
jgi:hypothetical protein